MDRVCGDRIIQVTKWRGLHLFIQCRRRPEQLVQLESVRILGELARKAGEKSPGHQAARLPETVTSIAKPTTAHISAFLFSCEVVLPFAEPRTTISAGKPAFNASVHRSPPGGPAGSRVDCQILNNSLVKC